MSNWLDSKAHTQKRYLYKETTTICCIALMGCRRSSGEFSKQSWNLHLVNFSRALPCSYYYSALCFLLHRYNTFFYCRREENEHRKDRSAIAEPLLGNVSSVSIFRLGVNLQRTDITKQTPSTRNDKNDVSSNLE